MPVIRDHNPITIRIGDIDPDTGWCEIFGRWNQVEEPSLSVIAGDYVHNLRSALDYVVTALVQASNAQLREAHQFPIFTARAGYRKVVGTATKAKPEGPLRGVRHGLTLIESFQPYHREADAETHPLAKLNRFSNTDKHRQSLMLVALPVEDWTPNLTFDIGSATCVETWQSPTFELPIGSETKLAALRFIEPFPPKVSMNETITMQAMFGVPPFPPRYPEGLLVSVEVLEELHQCVTDLVRRTEAL